MMQLGAQLFTLRDYTQTAKDFAYSMGQVAKMGYKTVQISAIGPIPAFPGAYLHALPFSILVSAISSCLWVKPTGMIVGKVYGGKQPV